MSHTVLMRRGRNKGESVSEEGERVKIDYSDGRKEAIVIDNLHVQKSKY